MAYFCEIFCCQEIVKITQSGHTGCGTVDRKDRQDTNNYISWAGALVQTMHGRRLVFKWLLVQIPALDTGWTFTLIVLL